MIHRVAAAAQLDLVGLRAKAFRAASTFACVPDKPVILGSNDER